MRVLFHYREKLVVKNNSFEEDYLVDDVPYSVYNIVKLMQDKIAMMCSQILLPKYEGVNYVSISIELDGKKAEMTYEDAKDILPPEIQKAIQDMDEAKEISISLDYKHIWHNGNDYLGVGPYDMQDLLDEFPEEVFDVVDYVAYIWSETCCNGGSLFTYGKRNGIVHRGKVELSLVDEIPSFGKWFSPEIVYVIAHAGIKKSDLPKVNELVKRLMELSSDDTYTFVKGKLFYNMDNALLDTQEKIERFISILVELAPLLPIPEHLTEEDSFVRAEFHDTSETGPNLMSIEVKYNRKVIIKTALAF